MSATDTDDMDASAYRKDPVVLCITRSDGFGILMNTPLGNGYTVCTELGTGVVEVHRVMMGPIFCSGSVALPVPNIHGRLCPVTT